MCYQVTKHVSFTKHVSLRRVGYHSLGQAAWLRGVALLSKGVVPRWRLSRKGCASDQGTETKIGTLGSPLWLFNSFFEGGSSGAIASHNVNLFALHALRFNDSALLMHLQLNKLPTVGRSFSQSVLQRIALQCHCSRPGP